jgi:hypothetical protein
LATDRNKAEHGAENRRRRDAGEQSKFRRQSPAQHRVARDVTARAEKDGMSEGQQTRESEQEIEGAGEQGEAQDLHHQHRVDHERRH